MKVKFFSIFAAMILLLAGCNNVQPPSQPLQTQQTQYVTQVVTQEFSQQVRPLLKDFEITNPDLSKPVSSPLKLTGKMTRQFFFEGIFPVSLQDSNGKVIASGQARGDVNWMTEDMPTFSATLTFASPTTDTGMLILQKDNPSGMPQNDESRKVKVLFKKPLAGSCDPNASWKNFTSDAEKVEFCYPSNFQKVPDIDAGMLITLKYPDAWFQGTNLKNATIDLSAAPDAQCLVSMYDKKPLVKTVVKNGATFYEDSWGEGAAGQIGENLAYNTSKNGLCYRFTLRLAYSNLDNYKDENGKLGPGAPKEFDKAGIVKLLGDIFATLKVK